VNRTVRPVLRHRPSVVELKLAAELAAANRRINHLTDELAETARARDQLRDLLDAMAWHTRWGRRFR
jgi:hypothetical protein